MRIALFHDLPSGGAKRTLYELVKRLAPRHCIDLYTLGGDERFCDLRVFTKERREFRFVSQRQFRSPFGRLNQLQRWRDLGHLARLSKRIAGVIDAHGYDLLLAEPSRWTQAPLLLPHVATPTIYHCLEPPRALYEADLNERHRAAWRQALDRLDPLVGLYGARARQLDREATRAAGRVLVASNFMRERVRAIYGVASHVLRLGVDGDLFHPGPAAARRQGVLSVGALQPSKGFDFVIRSLAEIPIRARPRLRIVANSEAPSERDYLTRLAASRGVQLAIELGVDDALLARRYAEATLFVYAPRGEPFGLAPLEAMACGTPVVAVAEGGVAESVVHDQTGKLVRRDAREFAAAVCSVLDDEASWRRLSVNGREVTRKSWTWDAAAAGLEQEISARVSAVAD